jgi:hypothetical protein
MIETLMVHLNAKGPMDLARLIFDGIVCTLVFALTAFPLLLNKEARKASWKVRGIHYVVALVFGALAILIWSGRYRTPVDPWEILPNVLVLIQALVVRGDIALWEELYIELIARRRARRLRPW